MSLNISPNYKHPTTGMDFDFITPYESHNHILRGVNIKLMCVA
jgi:hypothetical protein